MVSWNTAGDSGLKHVSVAITETFFYSWIVLFFVSVLYFVSLHEVKFPVSKRNLSVQLKEKM